MPGCAACSLWLWSRVGGLGGLYVADVTGNRGDVLGTATLYVLVFLFLIAARAERSACLPTPALCR